jgi:hypothetical protein
MNADLKDIKPLLLRILRWLRRYYALILFVVVGLLYGYIIFQINHFNRQQPTDTAVNERIKQVKRPSIDPQTAEKLKNLEDSSQEVQALFQNARQNPFQE